RLVAHLATLRHMSLSVAGMLERGHSPELEAAMVKDLGTTFEQSVPEIARLIVPAEPDPTDDTPYEESLARVLYAAPSFSLRGGRREILRSIIARGLRLR